MWVHPVSFGVLAVLMFGCLLAEHLSPALFKYRAKSRLRAYCSTHRILCLTFDDGPSDRLTARVLELLSQHRARATFFLIGSQVVGRETLLDRMVAAGHELGCHTFKHSHAWKSWPRTVTRDIADGYQSLGQWLPANGLFRPPFGKIVFAAWCELRRRRSPVVWWTHDSGDTFGKRAVGYPVLERLRRDGGGVVLLHDSHRNDPGHEEFVIAATQGLLDMAYTEGFRILTAGELLASMSQGKGS